MRRLAVLMLGLSLALLSTGCMWGIVRDQNTGAPISGAKVSYTDSQGRSATATTDANGVYAFDWASGPIPAIGPISATVDAPGYDTLSEPRQVGYDDNPNATLSNLSSYWEAQHFFLAPGASPLPPPGGGSWGVVAVDLAVTDIFIKPDNTPWARVTNHGPGTLTAVTVNLKCEMTQMELANPQNLHGMVSDWPITVTLAPGQTQEFDSRLAPVDFAKYAYWISCTLNVGFNDPTPGNNTHAENFPQP